MTGLIDVSSSKAHSRDKYTYSVMMALKDVAKYLNINLALVCTLLRWLEGPVVTRCLGLAILEEMRDEGTQVLDMEPESRTEIAALKCSKNRAVASWRKVSLN